MKLISIPGHCVAHLISEIRSVSLHSSLDKTVHSFRVVFINGDVKNYDLPTTIPSTAETIFETFVKTFNKL